MGKHFAHDYDLDLLNRITTKRFGFDLYVTPRFKYHFQENTFEETTALLIRQNAKGVGTFIDVGAHYGFYDVLVGLSNPACKILAFEPVPENCVILKKNLELNGVKAGVVQAAVSSHKGRKTFQVSESADSSGFVANPAAGVLRAITTNVVKLDDYLHLIGDSPVLIKVDVEGHELAILEGMQGIIEKCRDLRLVIEFNPRCLEANGVPPQELLSRLSALGLEVFFIKEEEKRYERYRLGMDWRLLTDGGKTCNLVCLPKERSLSLCFFSHSAYRSGAEHFLLELVESLTRKYGTLCTVVLPGQGPLQGMLEEVGAATVVADYHWWCAGNLPAQGEIHARMQESYQNVMDASILLARTGPDVILTNTMVIPWGAVLALKLNLPHVWMVREFGYGFEFFYTKQKTLEIIEESSNLILAISKTVRKTLFSHIDAKKCLVGSYSTITVKKPLKDAPEYFLHPGALKLVISGNVLEFKGQDDIIHAVKQLLQSGHDVELCILGDTDTAFSSSLKSLVEVENLADRIHFVDFRDDVSPVIAQADVALSCSRYEALGRTVLEAMLMAKPVIGTRVGGIPELIDDGVNGWLYAPGDIVQLTGRLEYFIKHPEKIALFGGRARQAAMRKIQKNPIEDLVYKNCLADRMKRLPVSRQLTGLAMDWHRGSSEQVARKQQELAVSLAEKQEALKKQGALVESLSARILQKDRDTRTLEGQLSKKDRALLTLSAQSAEKEKVLQNLSSQLSEREGTVQALSSRLSDKEGTIQVLSSQLSEKEGTIQALSSHLSEREGTIQALSSQLAENEGASQELSARLAEKEGAAQRLAGQLADKERVSLVLSEQLAGKEQDLHSLAVKLEQEQAQLTGILSSRDWRVASFVRRLRMKLAPPGSRRERALNGLADFFSGVIQKTRRKFYRREDLVLIRLSDLFDRDWYLSRYPDVSRAKMDPALHFLRFGGFEGRDPSRGFCTEWYRTRYPDVKNSRLNPLVHYLRFGRLEGRLPAPELVPARQVDAHVLKTAASAADQFTVFTISAKNFTAYVKTLYASLRQFHPGMEFVLFLCDGVDSGYDISSLPFKVVPLSELNIPDVEEMSQRYNITEFNTAVKPFAFSYLFKNLHRDKVVYLDPDILVLSPLQEVLDELSLGAECVLTPHILEPNDEPWFGDDKMLQFGIYNLGFVAFRNTPDVLRVVEWWGRRLVRGCVIDLEKGLFVDQKWADLFPAFLNRIAVLHHPGYNVAYWNLPQRKIECIDGKWLSNGQPLRFVHFSGHDLDDPYRFSRHVTGVTRDTIGDLKYLVDQYHDLIRANGHAEYLKLPYSFSWNGAGGVNLHTPKPSHQPDQPAVAATDEAEVDSAPSAEAYPPRQGFIHKLRSNISLLRTAARYAGGWSGLARKTMQAFRNGGFAAVQQGAVRTRSYMQFAPAPVPAVDLKAPAWMTRILIVDWSTPRPDQDAGSLSTFNLIRTYVGLGYDVTFIPSDLQYLGEYTEALRALGVRCLHREDIGSMQDFLRREGNDLQFVMLCRAPIAALYIPAVRQFASAAKIILNTIDLHFLREMREAELDGGAERLEKAKRVKEWELDIMQKCDVTIVLSSVELQMLQRELPHVDIRLLPLIYVDTTAETPGFSGRQDFLFIGGFRHTPNIDAVVYFCDEILPLIHESLPEVKFHIVGSDPPPQVLELGERKEVVVHGFVKDVAPLFQECRLSVAPLRYGAGIKGKIATSLAYGVPVVATRLAVEGMDLEAGKHILVADEPRKFADALLKAYKSKKLWTKLSEAGREQVFATYSAAAIQGRISALMQDINPQHKQFDLYTLGSKPEYDLLKRTIAPDILRRKEIELKLIDFDREQFTTDGFCAVCGCESQFRTGFMYAYEKTADGKNIPNWREHVACVTCGFTNRLRASMHIFLHQVKPAPSSAVYLTEQATPLFRWLKERYPNLVGSEYFGESVPLGAEKDGIRNEDLTALTFASDTFDHILSFDVLEHVPDDIAALKEVYRCLKPGGTFLFSAPFQASSAEKQVRARKKPDGTVEHLLPAEVHGNPVDKENGALCFRYLAWDLLQDMRAIGFEDPRVLCYWSRDFAYLGTEQFLFLARKGYTEKEEYGL